MRRSVVRLCVVILAAGALAAPVAAAAKDAAPGAPLVAAKTVPFKQDEPVKVDLAVGGLRVSELQIKAEQGSLLDSVLPPRGGLSRFSWLRYAFYTENPSADDWTLAVRVRLLDKKGVVIDEFEFRKDVSSGRARPVDFKRLTLDYVVPLIDRLELSFSAEK